MFWCWCAVGWGFELLSCCSEPFPCFPGMRSPLSGKRDVVCLVCKSGCKDLVRISAVLSLEDTSPIRISSSR